ncbi:FadR/GntR family transcriptional regulator [Clostridium butyricum]|uniref:FadR/GntR family transcriptional regulator n=1 Tax=Clostridium butyricum TaxID=1492 RepID=UPI00374F3CB1
MLNPVKNIKVYEAIIEQIKDSVKNGELKSGDKLPSERELAEKLQVSRTSVREALKALSMLGLIDSKHGDGNFIKSNVEDCLLEPLSVVFLLIGNRNEEIFQLRRIIEPEAAAIAANNITEYELNELRLINEKIKESSDTESGAELDRKFHYKIVKSSGNNILSTIMFSVSVLVEKYIDNSHIHNSNKDIVYSQHEDIYIALKEHNAEKAFNLVKKHLELGNI